MTHSDSAPPAPLVLPALPLRGEGAGEAPALPAAWGEARLTLSRRPSQLWPVMVAMACRASSTRVYVRKAKPLERPVSGSQMICEREREAWRGGGEAWGEAVTQRLAGRKGAGGAAGARAHLAFYKLSQGPKDGLQPLSVKLPRYVANINAAAAG